MIQVQDINNTPPTFTTTSTTYSNRIDELTQIINTLCIDSPKDTLNLTPENETLRQEVLKIALENLKKEITEQKA